MNVINIHDSSQALHRVAVTDAFSLRAKRSSHRFAVCTVRPLVGKGDGNIEKALFVNKQMLPEMSFNVEG